jgi:hypothetical protein
MSMIRWLGEGMAQIVEAHPTAWPVDACARGGAAKHTLGDVVVEKRRAVDLSFSLCSD